MFATIFSSFFVVGRTEPTVDDIGLAFRHLIVSPSELEEYITNADPVPYAHDVVAFPVPKKNNLQFPKLGSREVATRDESIPEYMPLMHPELEGLWLENNNCIVFEVLPM